MGRDSLYRFLSEEIGMPEEHRDELINSSRQSPAPNTESMLEAGLAVWLVGRPAHADDGFIALSLGEGQQTITIRERDVVDVDKVGAIYFVKVRANAQIVYRFEQVIEVRDPRACGCQSGEGCSASTASRTAMRVINDAPGGGGTINCMPDCWVTLDCFPFWDSSGYYRRYCVPMLHCMNPCDSEPS
jgi:hypothetical protein